MSQPARDTVIDQWTGRHATTLQAALRMSQDEMAVLIEANETWAAIGRRLQCSLIAHTRDDVGWLQFAGFA